MEVCLRKAREGAYVQGFEYALDEDTVQQASVQSEDGLPEDVIDQVVEDDRYETRELQDIRRMAGFQEVPVNTGRYERDLDVRLNYLMSDGRQRTEDVSCYEILPELERMWWNGFTDYVSGAEKYDSFTEGCVVGHEFHPVKLYPIER